jgi:hypothetical protein
MYMFLTLKAVCRWALDTSKSTGINEEYRRALLDFARAGIKVLKFM